MSYSYSFSFLVFSALNFANRMFAATVGHATAEHKVLSVATNAFGFAGLSDCVSRLSRIQHGANFMDIGRPLEKVCPSSSCTSSVQNSYHGGI